MKHIATIEIFADDDLGTVHAEVSAPRRIGRYRSGSFATVSALLNAVAPVVAELRDARDPIIRIGDGFVT